MAEVLREKLRSLKIDGLFDKTVLRISKIGLKELCSVAAVTYGILMFSVIAMGIVSIILLIAKKVTMKSTIPMAPFVILGFLLSIFAGM